MANRFGFSYSSDQNDESAFNEPSSTIPTTWSPDSLSQKSKVTPKQTRSQMLTTKYKVKPGSMSDVRMKREREKKERNKYKKGSSKTKDSKRQGTTSSFPPACSDISPSQTTTTQAFLTC